MVQQFAVRRCWETKFGLLIEREKVERSEEEEASAPVLFSLLHPLDDFNRVVTLQVMEPKKNLKYRFFF